LTDLTHARDDELDARTSDELRLFLDEAYDGAFADEDWEHAVGGVHVLLREDDALVAHAAVVERAFAHRDAQLRAGYVEALAVRRDRRRRGHGSAVMESVEGVIRAGFELGALSDGTGIDGFYGRRGWIPWAGTTWVAAPGGLERTAEDDGGVYVLRTPTTPELDVDGNLVCDWRLGDVW